MTGIPRRGLDPGIAVKVHLEVICSRNRYTVDPAPVLTELFQVTGDRIDVLAREWSGADWTMVPIRQQSSKDGAF